MKGGKRMAQSLALLLSLSVILFPAFSRAIPPCPSRGHVQEGNHRSGDAAQDSHSHDSHSHSHSGSDHGFRVDRSHEAKGSTRDSDSCCRAPVPIHFIQTASPDSGKRKAKDLSEIISTSFFHHHTPLVSYLGTPTHYGTGPPPVSLSLIHVTHKFLC